MSTQLISRRQMLMAGVCGLTGLAVGCGKRGAKHRARFQEREFDQVLAVCLDLSGSFTNELLGKDAKAFKFFDAVTSRYFQAGGRNNWLILSQISNRKDNPILWQGRPRSMSAFESADEFKAFMTSKTNPDSSPVYDSYATTVEEVMRHHKEGSKTRSMVVLLTDYEENSSDSGSERRLVSALTEYGRLGDAVSVGIYYVTQRMITVAENHLRSAGIAQFVVEPGSTVDPRLPQFRR